MSSPLLLAVRRIGSRSISGQQVVHLGQNVGTLSKATTAVVVTSPSSFGTAFFSTTSDADKNENKNTNNKKDGTKNPNNKNNNKRKNARNRRRNNKSKNASNQKKNFAETVLEPAARGEVPSNRRGIPKLAGRKSHSSQPFKKHDKKALKDEIEETVLQPPAATRKILRSGKKLKDVVRQFRRQNNDDTHSEQNQKQSDALQLLFDDNLDGVDPWDIDPDEELEKHPQITKEVDEDGNATYTLSFTEKDFQNSENDEMTNTFETTSDSSSSSSSSSSDSDSDIERDGNRLYNEGGKSIRFDVGNDQNNRDLETGELLPGNPDEEFFAKDIFDFSDPFPSIPDSMANRVLPLQETGDQVDDFVAAMYEHPSKYGLIQHFNSLSAHRRPQLSKLEHIQYPPPEFLETGKSFMYLSNVPNDDDNFSIDDSLACNRLSETVANLLSVSIINVFAAHKHGAFVRFSSPEEAATSVQKSKARRHNHQTSLLEIKVTSDDQKNSDVCKVQVANIPTSMSTFDLENLFATFFPKDTETIQVNRNATANAEVQFSLPSSQVTKVLQSTQFRQEVEAVRKMYSHVSAFACHRDRHISGYGGYAKDQPLYRKGTHLDIDFGLPAHIVENAGALRPDFYNSHASVWYMTQLPLNTTKKQISEWMQPYCVQKRDINGSIQLVTDIDGQFQGQAYVGFDIEIDSNKAFEELLSQSSSGGDENIQDSISVNWLNHSSRQIKISPIQDMVERGDKKKNLPVVGPRSERTEEELLQELDEEYMIEKYVSAEDIEFLESMKIDIQVIKDAFMATRHNNVSYSLEDGGIIGERFNDGKQPGDKFQEFCQLYIETLKEVVATPEDPGDIYKGLFLPNEDQSIDVIREDFETENSRLEKLQKQHYPHAK